jgi:hypothetical protein
MRLLFSLGKEICKRILWKGAYLSKGGSVGNLGRGILLWGDFRQVTVWRAPPLGSVRDMYKKAVEMGISVHRDLFGGTWWSSLAGGRICTSFHLLDCLHNCISNITYSMEQSPS